ncbi:hypothetical protein LTR08_004364 [Meristemomyces frigidus]|nr:hypothetical protein LTR08_004364 [Meristemomyces frigidus]
MWPLPYNRKANCCTRHTRTSCGECIRDFGPIRGWFDRSGNVNLEKRAWYRNLGYENVRDIQPSRPQGGNGFGSPLPRPANYPFSGLQGGTGSGLGTPGPTNSVFVRQQGGNGLPVPVNNASLGQQSPFGAQGFGGPTGFLGGQARNSGTPSDLVQFTNVTLNVGNFLGRPNNFDNHGDRFLPSKWYTIAFRKGRTSPWGHLVVPNVTAQDVLETCSESEGRKIVRVKEIRVNLPDVEEEIVGQALGKSIGQLVAVAEGEGRLILMLMVVDN